MGRRNEHSREQQREMALSAAERLLVREGLAGFSMRKVAQEIGYTVGNLYLLFANQDDLLATLSERTADALHAFLLVEINPLRDPAAKLRALGAGYIAFAQAHEQRFRLMFEHQLPAAMTPRPTADDRLRRLFGLIETHLREAMPRMKPQDVRVAAVGLWSAVHGVCVLAVTTKLKWSGLKDYRALSDLVVDTYLAGLQESGVTALLKRLR